ncbi:hypothetical protein [Salinicola endophyticus]|uniref:FimV N-terminal domain-containing protein n=1 Tax=Salinicola endophyticus TaxID=1949083 RepID=A0AB74UBW7_9GAMM
MRSWVTLFIGGCGLLLATRVQALGIGEPLTVSPLNRPLHAVLPLTASARLEPAQVTVTLADAAAYRRAGLTPDALGDGITARVEKRDGGLAIVLDSDQRVREPFLDLLLTVSWPQGQWQRDVSLLFDPPDYAAARPLLAAAGAASPEISAAGWPQTLTVAPGATLSTLAAALPPHQGVSLEAAMLALYRANRRAFVGGDLDRLRAGVSLDVPPVGTVAALTDQAPQALRALRDAADGADVGSQAESESLGQRRPAQVSGPDDTEALARQVAALTRQPQRQLATIADLERQRERLTMALAARATPLETGEAAVVAAKGLAVPTGDASADSAPASSTSTLSTSAGTAADASTVDDGVAASGSTPTAGEAATDDAAPDASSAAATSSPSPAKSTSLTPSASSTSPAATASNASAAAPSLWQRAVSWAPLLGALAILGLLWALLWQRRRARAQIAHRGENEMKGNAPEAHVEPPGAPRRRVPGKLLACIKRGRRRRRGHHDGAETETGAAAISQADIYIAYGRFAAARDWLEPRLTEDPRHRLSLIRALGELREIEAMERVLAGFDDSASRGQRRTAQALAADYRARYVDESCAVATDHAQAAAADTAAASLLAEDEGALSLARVEDVDALFDAALGSEASPAPEAPSVPERTPSSDSAPIERASTPPGSEGADAESIETRPDAAPTLALEPLPHAFDVAPETLGAAPAPTVGPSAAEPGEHRLAGAQEGAVQVSEGQVDGAQGEQEPYGEKPEGAAAASEAPQEHRARRWGSDGDATSATLAFGDDLAPQALRIDYQPPILELDDAPSPPPAPPSDSASEIEMPPLALDSQTWRPMGEPASTETSPQSVDAASPGSTSSRDTSAGNAPPRNTAHQQGVSPDDTSLQRGIPVGWEVEEVEFEPLHRDNGRP